MLVVIFEFVLFYPIFSIYCFFRHVVTDFDLLIRVNQLFNDSSFTDPPSLFTSHFHLPKLTKSYLSSFHSFLMFWNTFMMAHFVKTWSNCKSFENKKSLIHMVLLLSLILLLSSNINTVIIQTSVAALICWYESLLRHLFQLGVSGAQPGIFQGIGSFLK